MRQMKLKTFGFVIILSILIPTIFTVNYIINPFSNNAFSQNLLFQDLSLNQISDDLSSITLESKEYVLDDLGPYDYVIITNNTLRDASSDPQNNIYNFQDLADYKNSKGIQTKIVTVQEIYDNYEGVDEPEQIRNFLIDAYNNWGIEYVLLGGDADWGTECPECTNHPEEGCDWEEAIVPIRGLAGYAVPYTQLWMDTKIPSDFYYADLNGDWDIDGDGIWGEYRENEQGEILINEGDLTAEVYVGRAPVDDAVELSNFIKKTLDYERSNDISNVLMLGECLGSPPSPPPPYGMWAKRYMEEIRLGSTEHGYTTVGIPIGYNVETLYDEDLDPNRWSIDDLIDKIDDGVQLINHLGHGWYDEFLRINVDDIASFTNEKYFILYSQACTAGAIDNVDMDVGDNWEVVEDPENPGTFIARNVFPPVYESRDCIIEEFITSEHGPFAIIGNTRGGIPPLGTSTTDGPLQRFQRRFNHIIFSEHITEIGKAHQKAKEGFDINNYNGGRWAYFSLNLFGDPTTCLKTLNRLTYAQGDSWVVSSAVDSENKIHICWADDRNGNSEVYYNCFDGFTWTGEQRVTNNPGTSIPSSIAIGPDNKVHIVWQNNYPGEPYLNFDIYYKTYDEVNGWSVEQQLTTSKRAKDAIIAVDMNKIHLIWADGRDDPIFHETEIYYKSSNNGIDWSTEERITNAPKDSYVPSLAIDQRGDPHVIFSDNRDDNWKIYYTTNKNNKWTNEIPIAGPSDNFLRGNMVIGPDNIMHFLYADEIANHEFELYYRSYEITGKKWNDPELIPLDDLIVAVDFPPIFRSIAISQNNFLYIPFSDGASENSELYYVFKDQNGWSSKKQLTFAPGYSVLPNIITTTYDNVDKIFIFWNDDRNGNLEIYYRELSLINTPMGTDVEVIDPITSITLNFDEITSSGSTNIAIIDDGPDPPRGYSVSNELYYDITTTASYIPPITIAIPYDDTQLQTLEDDLQLMRWDPVNGWEDILCNVDTINNIIYAELLSLSIYAVMFPSISLKLEKLKYVVIDSPNCTWKEPAINRKVMMIEKIEEAIILSQDEEYKKCYDKVLHDIKPKLTGLKVDEEGNIFGDGVFKNPWIIDPALRQEFIEVTDSILLILKSYNG